MSERFEPGDQVFHPMHGRGQVMPREQEYVDVQFDNGEIMTLSLKYAKLQRIDESEGVDTGKSGQFPWWKAFDEYCEIAVEAGRLSVLAQRTLKLVANQIKSDWEHDLIVAKLAGTIWTQRNWLRGAFNLTDEGIQGCIERYKQRDLELRIDALRSMPYHLYLQTSEWKERSALARQRAGYRCQVCNAANVILNVHHRTYERRGNENDGDLIVLCQECHYLFHENSRLAEGKE